eukprot:GHRR01007634.1.p1 GENE.GHRR01007634.1~~GHRR01007634.1.p1  ORF type:complete len:386 (+),score=128.29 GHRR01007634.1:2236-3393(+)
MALALSLRQGGPPVTSSRSKLLLLFVVLEAVYVQGARSPLPAFSRFNLPAVTPQAPDSYSVASGRAGSSVNIQPSDHDSDRSAAARHGLLHKHSEHPEAVANQPGQSQQVHSTTDQSAGRVLQQQTGGGQLSGTQGDNSSVAVPPANQSTAGDTAPASTASDGVLPQSVRSCPAWAPDNADTSATLQIETPVVLDNGTTSTETVVVDFSVNYNTQPSSGITAVDRTTALSTAAREALTAALPGGNDSSNSTQDFLLAFQPGLFEPLSQEEILDVYAFLFSRRELDLTPIESAGVNDNYVAWLELQPPPKGEAILWLDEQDRLIAQASRGDDAAAAAAAKTASIPMPARTALAMLIQGRHNPPRVVQVCWCDSRKMCQQQAFVICR